MPDSQPPQIPVIPHAQALRVIKWLFILFFLVDYWLFPPLVAGWICVGIYAVLVLITAYEVRCAYRQGCKTYCRHRIFQLLGVGAVLFVYWLIFLSPVEFKIGSQKSFYVSAGLLVAGIVTMMVVWTWRSAIAMRHKDYATNPDVQRRLHRVGLLFYLAVALFIAGMIAAIC